MSSLNFRSDPSRHPAEFGAIYPPDLRWLALQPPEEALFPDLEIIDAHHHLWEVPDNRYSPDEFADDLADGHNVVATVYAECKSAYWSDGRLELQPVGETEHVARITSVPQPTRVAAGIIGFADLELGDRVEEVLLRHIEVADRRFRGIRFSTGWDASERVRNPHSGQRPNMLTENNIQHGARRLADLGLVLDVRLFHPQLADVAVLADAVPTLQIVLDHCGGPLGYGPYARDRAEHFKLWRAGVRDVAQRPNVACKLGGLLSRGAAFDYLNAKRPPTSRELAAIWKPWILTCAEEFGAQRCMFESNFPVEKMGTGYTTLWNTFKRLTIDASAADRRSMFFETARRVYRLHV